MDMDLHQLRQNGNVKVNLFSNNELHGGLTVASGFAFTLTNKIILITHQTMVFKLHAESIGTVVIIPR